MNKGKKPADASKPKPGAKGAASKEEEPTEEEVAQMKAEVAKREEQNAKLKADWDALDKNT